MPTKPDTASAATELQQFPYWRRNLRVLPVANLLSSLGFAISWPFIPLMVRSLGVHENLETWIGHMMLVFYIIGFIVSPIWGSIADHFGRKLMVLRAMLGMGFFMVLLPLASSPLAFAGMLMLVGLFNGFTPAGISLLAANTPPARLGIALSLALTGSLVGQTMGPALGALIADRMPQLHGLFWVSGGLLLAGGVLVLLFTREIKQLAPGPWRPRWLGSLKDLLAVPRMGVLFFLAFVFAASWSGNIPIITIYMLRLLGENPGTMTEATWVGAAAMGLAMASVISLPIWGKITDRFGAAPVLVFTIVASAVAHVLLIVLQTPLQLVLARVAYGLTAAAMQPAYMHLIRIHAPPGMDARAIAYATAFQFIGMGLVPFFAGIIGPALGLRTYFALVMLLTLAGLAMWLVAQRRASAATQSTR